jgi:ribosome maturation protein SDO1
MLIYLGKKRYEIACYKNKVLEWRSGVEKDLDNVLQIPNVFLSVSKGQVAPSQELAKSFGKDTSLDDIILEILNKGELQVGEKERHAELERIHNEVIDIVASKLIDPKTKRVYTTGMIEKALEQLSSQSHTHQGGKGTSNASGTATPNLPGSKGTPSASGTTTPAIENLSLEAKDKGRELPSWTGVTTNKSAKSQALEAMKALIAHQPIPVTRARMRLRITCPTSILKQAVKGSSKPTNAEEAGGSEEKAKGTVKDQILSYVEQVESQDTIGGDWEVTGFVEPGAFKHLTELIATQTKGRARAEVLDMAVVYEGD